MCTYVNAVHEATDGKMTGRVNTERRTTNDAIQVVFQVCSTRSMRGVDNQVKGGIRLSHVLVEIPNDAGGIVRVSVGW